MISNPSTRQYNSETAESLAQWSSLENPLIKPAQTRFTYCQHRWEEMSIWTKTFCLVAITNYICLTTLAVEPLIENRLASPYHTKPAIITRTLTFLLIIIFQTLHAYYGIFHSNIYELYATMITQLGVTIIIILRSIFLPQWDLYSILQLSYSVFFQILYVVYAIPLHKGFSWSFYKKAGADMVLQRKYRSYLLFHVLLKMDCMAALINIMVFDMDSQWLLVIGVFCGVISVIYYFLGKVAYTEESIPLSISFWILSTVCPVFTSFGIYWLSHQRKLEIVDFQTLSFGEYDKLVFSFLFVLSGVFLIVMRVLLLVQSLVVFQYFGEGLANLDKKIESYWNPEEIDGSADSSADSMGFK